MIATTNTNQEDKMKDLPFAQCGIVKSSLVIGDDEVSYTLEDGREVSCPEQGAYGLMARRSKDSK